MAPVDTQRLMARARRAYEWGRLRRAAWEALAATPLALGLLLVCPQERLAWTASALLYPTVVALRWRGEAWGRGAAAGLAAAAIPLVCAALLLSCGHLCPARAWPALCMATSVAAGIAAGGVAGLRSTRLTSGTPEVNSGVPLSARSLRDRGAGSGAFLGSAGLLIALVGIPACGFAGLAGALGLLGGATAGAAPFALARTRGA